VGAVNDRADGRRRKLLLGAALTVLCHGIAVIYCLMTLPQPNRSLMLAAYGCGVTIGVVGFWIVERETKGALPYRFSFAMLVITIVTVALTAHWDGGAGSPAALGFVVPALFVASFTTRLPLMVSLETVIIGLYLVVATTGEPARPGYVFIHVSGMLSVIIMSAAQGRMVAQQRSQLRSLAELDPLTGALNRRGLAKHAERLFMSSQGLGPSVVCLDLDDFKLVNDDHGHAAGDELLRWTVAAVRDVLRAGDAIARTGGDEFVVVLVDADEATAKAVASRIGGMVRQRTGISIGSASAPHDGDTLDALIEAADHRLYQAKQERSTASLSKRDGQRPMVGHPDALDSLS
jgi:diguanylate cyclase (GGDEF)-like protein